eukprot:TRINITY_DN37228_c0_g1_i1.p2 TRINITY_DN37228_c0_g1~~TRINITY_DN37228_c0_g1_i1.p2  ORF type:complete len:100 (+),score=15.99 TRINITY_DN37228_c0_g1_i1:178-477(+)
MMGVLDDCWKQVVSERRSILCWSVMLLSVLLLLAASFLAAMGKASDPLMGLALPPYRVWFGLLNSTELQRGGSDCLALRREVERLNLQVQALLEQSQRQ